MPSDFSIQELWNKSFDVKPYKIEPRNYLRASEIGKSYLDVYLALKGVEPTNPFDERTLRKFEAGRLFEWLVGNVFRKAGLNVKTNESIAPIKLENCLPIYGHYDYLVSGCANWDESIKKIEAEKFPGFIEQVCLRLIEWLRNKYPILYDENNRMIEGLPPTLYEVKSANSMLFWSKKDYLIDAYDGHKMQGITYIKGLGMDSIRFLYISKDDLTLAEFEVTLTRELEAQWLKWVEDISHYVLNGIQPESEPDIVYDEEKKRWDTNWKVERSLYLTYVTGLSVEEWKKKWTDECSARNRVLGVAKAQETRRLKKEAVASKE